jgi:hypothetical protein
MVPSLPSTSIQPIVTFRAHVQGRRQRFKIRVRHYSDSGLCSLEVKLRGGRGEAIKHRIPYDADDRGALTRAASAFLGDCLRAAYGREAPADLRPVVRTRYRRATLVHQDGDQRITCDFDLSYPADATAVTPPLSAQHVIVEAKSRNGRGDADRVMREIGQRPVSCSKYLLGVGLQGLRPVPPDLRRLSRRYFSPTETAMTRF